MFWCFAFFCLGSFLRIYRFWVPELWIDEYGTWWAVAGQGWMDVVRRVTATQAQSPCYYFLVKGVVSLFGASPLTLRLPSVIFGIGIMGMAYAVASQVFRDRRAAWLALAVFAVDERLIWYAQEARPYSLALFCAMGSFCCYLSLRERPRWPIRLGYLLATAGAFYVHYLFGFIVVIQAFHLSVTQRMSWRSMKPWVSTWLAFAVLCLPAVGRLLGLFLRRESLDYLPPQDSMAPLDLAIEMLRPSIFSAIALLVLVLGIGGPDHRKVPLPRVGPELLLIWLFAPLICFGVIPPLFGVTLLRTRYVLYAVPAALLCVVWLIMTGSRMQLHRWLLLAAFCALTVNRELLPSLWATGTFSSRPDQRWASAAQMLKVSVQQGDAILYRSGFVEGDDLAQHPDHSVVRSLMSWPLTANLPGAHPNQVLHLPFRATERTRTYLTGVLQEAAQHRRVWVVGISSMVPNVAHALIEEAHFRLQTQSTYGEVQVLLLEQERPKEG